MDEQTRASSRFERTSSPLPQTKVATIGPMISTTAQRHAPHLLQNRATRLRLLALRKLSALRLAVSTDTAKDGKCHEHAMWFSPTHLHKQTWQ